MNRKKIAKAVCFPVAAALGASLVTEVSDEPHVESRQHEDEPRMTKEITLFTATTGAVYGFPTLNLNLESIRVPIIRSQKK
jgi:hypothetical protein